jgi:hypothetical protein
MRLVEYGRLGAVVVGLSHLRYGLRDALDSRNGSGR